MTQNIVHSEWADAQNLRRRLHCIRETRQFSTGSKM